MEQIKNEDGALYSAYLKLEEKRVLKQIRKVITNYNLSGSNVDMTEVREANQAMRYIKGEIDTTKGGFSPEILEYIIRNNLLPEISSKYKYLTEIFNDILKWNSEIGMWQLKNE